MQGVRDAEQRIRLTCQTSRYGRLLEATRGKMSVREPDVGQVEEWIERAQADRTPRLLDRRVVVALPGADDELKPRARAEELDRANDRSNAAVAVS